MTAQRPVANYTTSIGVTRTVSECQKLLADYGAQRIAIDYENGVPTGVSFALPDVGLFTLPVDIEAMHRLLVVQRDAGLLRGARDRKTAASRQQAERVAWRVIKDWLLAQMSIIESRMVTFEEVMLPYLHTDDGRTLREAYRTRELEARR